MHIEYRISEADYRSAAMLAMRRRSTISALDYFLPYIFAIVWIAASLMTGAAEAGLSDSTDLIFVLGAIPILAGFVYRRRTAFGREYRRSVQFHLLQVLNLDTTGLRIGTDKPVIQLGWNAYTKFAENAQVFILFQQGNHHFLPIVKGHLTMLQVDELRSLLLSRLPQS
jgi:hypothetical protein